MHGVTHLEDLATRIKPKAASSLLLWMILGFVTIFFIWAAIAKIDRTVRGQGRVIPSSHLQIVSNLEGGVVQEILVHAGQEVHAGDPLIRLDPTMSGSELGSGEANVTSLQVKIARLIAEIQDREPQYPTGSAPGLPDQIRIEQALHSSRLADLAGILGAARARISQAQRAVAEAEASVQAKASTFQERQHEAEILRPLVDRGIEPRLSLVQAESAAEVARNDLDGTRESVSRARGGVAEAQASLEQAHQQWRAQAATDLATAQAELAARQRSLPGLANRMERTVLRAPMSGRINRVLASTVGGTMRAGEPAVEIVPNEGGLLIEARVKPADIGFVRIGESARVGITAYDRSVYGLLEGTVVGISPDAIAEERTGETYYIVRVHTNESVLRDPDGHPAQIGSGMVAEVDLLGDKRTILQYLLTPITRVGETAFREE